MAIEEFWYIEDGETGVDKVSENKERKWQSSKASKTWVKKVKKDEQKAKKYDDLLSQVLIELIKNNKYDQVVSQVFDTLDAWYNSNLVLWILSIAYNPISDKIRDLNNMPRIEFNYRKTQEKIVFDDDNVDKEIQNRINYWIEDITLIVSREYSSLQMLEIQKQLWNSKQNKELILLLYVVFVFFFSGLNMDIKKSIAVSYSKFIANHILQKIKKIEIDEI